MDANKILRLILILVIAQPLMGDDLAATKPAWAGGDDALPVFPKPNPASWHAEAKLLQPDGSPYRTAREDWDAARRMMDEDADWTAWLVERRAKLDAWMARHRERVEWRAGWWHDFVSPKDGAWLVWTDDIPGEQTDHLISKSGDRVEITPKIFDSWVYGFRKRNIEQMLEAARLYHLTQEPRYSRWAAGQLDFYADSLQHWPVVNPLGSYGRLGCQGLDDATWLVQLTETARLLKGVPEVSPERFQAWFDNLFKPETELLDRSFHIIHNIAVWHRVAVAQVALLYNDEAMWKRSFDGPYGLRAQLGRGVTSDYLWYEQSMGYNNFIIRALQPLLTFASLLGRTEMLRDEAAVVQNLAIAPLLLRFPDGTIPNPADGGAPGRASADQLVRVYRITPTIPGLAAAQSGKRDWDVLLDPPADVAAEFGINPSDLDDTLPTPRPALLESSQFVLLKDAGWQVFLHYGQLSRSHAQSEALNWSASFEGISVTHDPGTAGYGSSLTEHYYRHGLNHNVPLIDSQGQNAWRAAPSLGGELIACDITAGNSRVQVAQPHYRDNAAATRTMGIDAATNALIDEVTISSTDASGENDGSLFGLVLHLDGTPALSDAFVSVSLENFKRGRPQAFAYWQDIKAAKFTDAADVDVTFPGGKTLRVHFVTKGAFTLYQGTSPDFPPGHRAGFYLEKTESARAAHFTTQLMPRDHAVE